MAGFFPLSVNWSRLRLRLARHPVLCPGAARVPMAPILMPVEWTRTCLRSRVGDTITAHRHLARPGDGGDSVFNGHLGRLAGAGAPTNESEAPVTHK